MSAPVPFRLFVFAIWGLFIATVLLLDWRDSLPIHIALGSLGALGFAASGLWLVRNGSWIYSCLACSLAMVVAYCAWWWIRIANTARIAQVDLVEAAVQLFQTWQSLVVLRATADGAPSAALSFYWLFGMPTMQVIVLVAIGALLTRRNNSL